MENENMTTHEEIDEAAQHPITEFRNAKYNALGGIDMEVKHKLFGWVPFTATPDDPDEIGRLLYTEAVQLGDIAEYTPPPPPSIEEVRASMKPLSPMQFRRVLNKAGMLQSVIGAIDAMDEPQRSDAQIVWEYATEFQRTHPLIAQLAPALGLSEEQVDALWNQGLAL